MYFSFHEWLIFILMWFTWIFISLYGLTNHNFKRAIKRKNLKKANPPLDEIAIKKLKNFHVKLVILNITVIIFSIILTILASFNSLPF